jgi:uncharacterized peroxidase-related enzyme
LAWVEDDDADEATKEAFAAIRAQRGGRMPPVLRAMSLRPDLMVRVSDLAQAAHFTGGYLPVATKEMIATYVSALNSCDYCRTSHAEFARRQGVDPATADALRCGDLEGAGLSDKDRALLSLVELQTRHPANLTDASIDAVRRAGWQDTEIFEALFDGALFAFFNRIAEGYGLSDSDFTSSLATG